MIVPAFSPLVAAFLVLTHLKIEPGNTPPPPVSGLTLCLEGLLHQIPEFKHVFLVKTSASDALPVIHFSFLVFRFF